MSRRIAAAGAIAAVALGGATALAAPASAAPAATPTAKAAPAKAAPAKPAKAAAAYNGACGTGYTVIDSRAVSNTGTVYLTYNSSLGKNCAVTIRNTTGSAVPMSVSLAVVGGDPVTDTGDYTSYAGPVYLDAAKQCVQWGGSIGVDEVSSSGHCG
ncbi:spore-associated protein A [Streptomyces sp. NPDC050560]|uniref:spore-associated protein A n=1 Tax=Streptomyces sp. NPDC050560 TaxID=3365630 RepID=UPI0037916A78